MSSPPNGDGIISSSPQSIRIVGRDGSPVHARNSSPTNTRNNDIERAHSNSPTLARHSPSISRAHHNPLDPDVRERQRTMDADMAMHLSRARRSSVSSSPTLPTPFHHADIHTPRDVLEREHYQHEDMFPTFSLQEERDLESAKRGPAEMDAVTGLPEEDEPTSYERVPSPDLGLARLALSQGHEPTLLAGSRPRQSPEPDTTETGLPLYQPPVIHDRPTFRFGLMEDFAKSEKRALGLATPGDELGPASFLRQRSSHQGAGGSGENDAGPSAPPDFIIPPSRPTRERKLSHSNHVPRRQGGGKMALFESGATGASSMSAPRLSHLSPPGPLNSALSSFENLPAAAALSTPGILPGGNGGHDRPYRFSFYSNALSATIHARSLSELPAEDQSFEDMFSGSVGATRQAANGKGVASEVSTAPQSYSASPAPGSYFPEKLGSKGGNGLGPAGPTIPNYARINGDGEGHTWWLDVLSPTDEEMKLLSQVFGIHPLTTEDIQTEESREKIELFRTYYLVCFRSFDQDPYSPTHLEPVNMYIIVFREGILSFHFRATPHPQNVRRRIKQLRDYISVTSDWISYALIDDITDAFGPLIQSIEYEVDSIDELVLILKDAEQSDMLRRIGTCRKKVMGLLRLMGNKADVVKGLAKRCNENWKVAPTGDIGLYLSDIQDHLITMTQNLNHYEKILSRSHSNYLAQISIEMTDANNQINDVLSKLTALGTVLVPMNLITGLWGMNVHVPGQDIEEGYAWFGAIVGALAAIALIGGYTTYKLMTR
ncbi:unnamed protein product [Peniophora sp. CBMAI 1063]|nr:unnamed protein product [Peniophora sp. CBMAI 1063]